MLERVAIDGHGIAATCCAQLLRKRGLRVAFAPVPRSAGLTLLINPSTQRLLTDVFETGENLFSDMPIVRKRIVRWGREPEVTVLPHSGLVVNEVALLERLWPRVDRSDDPSVNAPDWLIHSSSTKAPGTSEHFGSRRASTIPVYLKEPDADACWIESMEDGWLFLVPSGKRNGSLMAVGQSAAVLLDQSRLIANLIEEVAESKSMFDAYPRILKPLCAPGWLACGTAAMSFDPICGEGAGNAVREAILASAVIGVLATDLHVNDPLEHYSSRLLIGFLRHLQTCREFYLTARRSAWWDSELAELERGIEWIRAELLTLPKPRYRLHGFDLIAVT